MKFIIALALVLAIAFCEDYEVKLKTDDCKATEATGAFLMKGNNKLTITLEADTNCTAGATYAAVGIEKR